MVFHAAGAQLLAHHARKRAVRGLGDIVDSQQPRVALIAGAERGNYRDAALKAGDYQVELAADDVDRIDHVVVIGYEALAVGRLIAPRNAVYLDLRVYIPQPPRHDLRLRHADGGFQRAELAVYIAHAHGVLIDKGHPPDAGASKRFRAPRPDAAEAKHRDVAIPQPVHRALAQQHPCPEGTFVHKILLCRNMKTGESLPSPVDKYGFISPRCAATSRS